MENPCMTCKYNDYCEDQETAFVKDIIQRGHGRCGDYEPAPKKHKKNEKKTLH